MAADVTVTDSNGGGTSQHSLVENHGPCLPNRNNHCYSQSQNDRSDENPASHDSQLYARGLCQQEGLCQT